MYACKAAFKVLYNNKLIVSQIEDVVNAVCLQALLCAAVLTVAVGIYYEYVSRFQTAIANAVGIIVLTRSIEVDRSTLHASGILRAAHNAAVMLFVICLFVAVVCAVAPVKYLLPV